MQEFFQMLQLLATNSIGIIVGVFNYDLLQVSQNKILDIFADHVQMVNKPTHIFGFLVDLVKLCTSSALNWEENVLFMCIYGLNSHL